MILYNSFELLKRNLIEMADKLTLFGRPDISLSAEQATYSGAGKKSNLEDTEWKDIHDFGVFPFLIVVADSPTHRHSASETNNYFLKQKICK
jgi:hypothetical protein